MSTNFYLRNIKFYEKIQKVNTNVETKLDEIIEEIKVVISDESKLNQLHETLLDSVVLGCDDIHIGKRSVGWKPSFRRQEEFTTVRELKQFYNNNKDDYKIIDEYNRVLSWDELEEELIQWTPDGKENHHSYKDEDGYLWNNYEFC